MYLHKDRDNFKDLIEQVAMESGRTPIVVEKDYYVTLILKLLSDKLDNVVFKGGTSLSKGYKAINRFSEDIDITFSEHIGEARRKKLKNVVLKEISEDLEMPIANWEQTQSDRDYNAYLFSYKSVFDIGDDRILSNVKLETALGSYSFPTEYVEIGNYCGDYFQKHGRADLAEQFSLNVFKMKLQSLERTYIDKIFALCDYYMEGKSKRYSRHLYDLKKLSDRVVLDDKTYELFVEVRNHRKNMEICPSAKENVNLVDIINEFCSNDFYKEDYNTITNYFADDMIQYSETIEHMRSIAKWVETMQNK